MVIWIQPVESCFRRGDGGLAGFPRAASLGGGVCRLWCSDSARMMVERRVVVLGKWWDCEGCCKGIVSVGYCEQGLRGTPFNG